ncbi:MAG: sugar ABC transporter ATP-binding protein [bacterium]
MHKTFLLMKNISKVYAGVQALNNVDFILEIGEIHCLVGENGSGKSTLIKIISGVEKPEKGAEIFIEGKKESIEHFSSKTSIERGIHVIYQDISLFPNLSVAENISFYTNIEGKRKFVRWKEIRKSSKRVMDEIGIHIDLDRIVSTLSIADQQLIAICRALIGKTKLLIMDEPTSSLTRNEVEALFGVIKKLKKRGITILFVSHKLNEILAVAERVTVLRDGKKIGTFNSKELDSEKLTYYMTGKKVYYLKLNTQNVPKQVLLEVKNLSKRGNFKDINFTLYKGEILGITGLLGSGRTELAKALFGINPAEEGEIYIEGNKVNIRTTNNAIRHGIGLVPENRLLEGLVMPHSVGNNIVITILEDIKGRINLIDTNKKSAIINKYINDLAIKAYSHESPVMTLSGGNQQRVVLAKWIATKPKILILDGPTIGIDVAAKSDIHQIIRLLAFQGIGIIIISDELQEVLYNCHRILIMSKGRIIKELTPQETSVEELSRKYDLG